MHDHDVTVIVPVYNKARFLTTLLDSLARQRTASVTFDVVAVDDGSTDGSGDILDDYATRHSWLRVIHQQNSGWPGQPRNRGMAQSSSRYVFFADGDDFFGEEALERMVKAADQLACDVLIPRYVDAENPDAAQPLFRENLADVPIPMRFKTLTPHKLFRRDFLDEHALRFVEYKAPLEDGMLMANAYLLARRVSLVADYPFYYRVPGGETSISSKRRDPWAQRNSVGTILSTVRKLCDDQSIADAVCLDIYRRKGIRYIGPNRLPNYPPAFREQHVLAAADLADQCMPPELEKRLSVRPRLRSKLVRQRDPEASYQLAVAERDGPPPVRVEGKALVLDTGPGRATVNVTRDVRIRVQTVEVAPMPGGFEVTANVVTPGVLLRTRECLALAARGRDGVVPLEASVRTADEEAPSDTITATVNVRTQTLVTAMNGMNAVGLELAVLGATGEILVSGNLGVDLAALTGRRRSPVEIVRGGRGQLVRGLGRLRRRLRSVRTGRER